MSSVNRPRTLAGQFCQGKFAPLELGGDPLVFEGEVRPVAVRLLVQPTAYVIAKVCVIEHALGRASCARPQSTALFASRSPASVDGMCR